MGRVGWMLMFQDLTKAFRKFRWLIYHYKTFKIMCNGCIILKGQTIQGISYEEA